MTYLLTIYLLTLLLWCFHAFQTQKLKWYRQNYWYTIHRISYCMTSFLPVEKNIYDTSLYTFYFLFVFCLCSYQLVWHFFDTTFFILVWLLFSGICICSHFTECYKIWFNKYSCKGLHFKCYCYMGVCFAAVNIQCMMCGVLYTQINLPFLRTSIFMSCAYLIMFSKRLSLCDVIVGISHYIVSILLLFMYKICLAL